MRFGSLDDELGLPFPLVSSSWDIHCLIFVVADRRHCATSVQRLSSGGYCCSMIHE